MSTEPLDFASSELLNDLNPKWWYLYGAAYDFSDFVWRHPGGEQAISLGQGRDCTALFESYHTRLPSKEMLRKYKVSKEEGIGDKVSIDNATFEFNDDGFYHRLKKKTIEYFERNGIEHTKGGFAEICGWILNLTVFAVSCYYSFCVVIPGSSVMAMVCGVSKSLLVVRSTHSASHFAFSVYPALNRFVYWLNMTICGDTPAQWTAKHVVAHHIDTNVTPIDDDTMYPIKRVLPSLQRHWLHRFQHLYIWLLYAFVFVPWTLSHNIKFMVGVFLNQGRVYEGMVQCRHNSVRDWMESVSCIAIQWFIRLLPFWCLSSWWNAVVISCIFEMSSSVWFSLQFAVNHETLESVYNECAGHHNEVFSDFNGHRDFGAHQVMTSHNYSVGKWMALQVSGGLNYQIEHHLYPSVHNKHYPALSKIVQETAAEFDLPYHASSSFWVGVRKHAQLLYIMGNYDSPKKTL